MLDFITPVLLRLADGDEVREGLISRAVQDFLSNPIFGRGLGYAGNLTFTTLQNLPSAGTIPRRFRSSAASA